MSRRPLGASYRVAAAVIRPTLVAFTRTDWAGAENLPDGGFVACCNHISHLDPLTLSHFLHDHDRPPRFLAKESIFQVPVVGRIVSGAGQIPVYRESATAGRALAPAVDAVQRGECVVVYPEATLTRDPELWPMVGKTGAARIALTAGCPVVPIAQWGVQEILPPYSSRPRLLPRKLIRVRAGAPVDLSRFAGRPLDVATLRVATDAILEAITLLLQQIRGGTPPATRWDPRQHGQSTHGRFDADPPGPPR